ncbi:MAG: hypothetical protein HYY96_09305 [Candidatus Tectomicrobia bacterium]|nr:hypothetical protein [Candidatus Tectomicrobia bacterium]
MILLSLALMAAAVAWTLIQIARKKMHPLGLPTLAAGSFAFLYVWQPAYLLATGKLHYFLSEAQIVKGVLTAFVMYIVFHWGWFYGGKGRLVAKNMRWDYRRLYHRGLLLGLLGMGLFLIFLRQSGGAVTYYSAVHGAAGAWQQQTAWVYMGKKLIFPALVMMIIARQRARLGRTAWFMVVVLGGLIFADGFLMGSRGILFPWAVTIGMTAYLTSGIHPRVGRVFLAGLAVGLAVLLLVGYRSELRLGGDLSKVSLREALLATSEINEAHLSAQTTGIEFVYHSGMIDAIDETKTYNLGVNWLYMTTIHLIPRLLWPNKPYGWSLASVNLSKVTGLNIAGGAAYGLVADFYREFGQASVFLWFLLGYYSRRLFRMATEQRTPGTILVYVLWYAWGLHLFAQGFGALLIPYLYTLVPGALLALSCRRRITTVLSTPVMSPTGGIVQVSPHLGWRAR